MNKRGFTLVELLTGLVIAGVAVAFILPNLTASMESAKSQAAKNNLMAIAAAQQRYSEDNNGAYYIDCAVQSCPDDKNLLNRNLQLSIPTNDPFSYSCKASGNSYVCTAKDPVDTLTLDPTAQNLVTCAGPANQCPA